MLRLLVQTLVRGKFGASQSRGDWSSKRVRGMYKGKGARSLGFHTRKGGYKIVQEKVPVFVVPDLTDCKLLPYVSRTTPKL